MYVGQIPLCIISLPIMLPDESTIVENCGGLLLGIAFSGMGIAFVICALLLAFSIVSIFKGENASRMTMIIKIVLIPWYIVNFILCVCLIGGMLNPFLMLTIPIAVFLMISTTYINMLASGLPDIAFFVHLLIKKKVELNATLIISILFMFIFCLDAIGGILFYIKTREIEMAK